MTLNDLTALVEKNSLACDNPNSRDMLATDGSQDRKYLTLADETRATAFQTVVCTENLSSGVAVVKSAQDGA